MKTIFFISILSLSVFSDIFSQSIKGRVLETETGKPVPYVNVYLSGTTLGSATDESGGYFMNKIPPGTYQLIASAIGYTTQAKTVTISAKSNLNVDLEINLKIYETEEVTVSGERPYRWDENYREFRKLFVGSSAFAGECIIKNPEVLSFRETEEILEAFANRPLIIINEALGYNIDCELISFSYRRKNGHLKYHILPRFSEPGEKTKEIELRRRSVYLSSIQYFLKSLMLGDFSEKGFIIYKKTFYDAGQAEDYIRDLVEEASSIVSETEPGIYELRFKDYLKVIHKGVPSWIKLEYDSVLLNPSGFSNVFTPFEVRGFWASEGISTLLPTDYEPD